MTPEEQLTLVYFGIGLFSGVVGFALGVWAGSRD